SPAYRLLPQRLAVKMRGAARIEFDVDGPVGPAANGDVVLGVHGRSPSGHLSSTPVPANPLDGGLAVSLSFSCFFSTAPLAATKALRRVVGIGHALSVRSLRACAGNPRASRGGQGVRDRAAGLRPAAPSGRGA